MAGMAFGTSRFAHVGGVRIDVALVRFLGEVFVASAVASQTLFHRRFVIGGFDVATRAGHASRLVWRSASIALSAALATAVTSSRLVQRAERKGCI